MNWTQLVDRVIISFNPEETLSPTAKQYLIDAQEDFVLETKCLDRWKWFYVPAEQGYIDLPDDFVQLLRLEHDGQRLDEITLHQPYSIHQSDETKRPGLPEGFYPQGNRVYFYPCYSTAEWVALWYVYKPNVLTDSDTDYRKLAYDALTAHFVKGETVTDGTTATTGVVEFDDNNIKTGILTLSSVTGGSGVFGDDSVLTGSENGVAVANGADAAFATAGDNPDIPDPYRKYLVDYARSQLYEDRDDIRKADRAMARYMVNSDRIADHFQNRIKTGTTHIIDHYG